VSAVQWSSAITTRAGGGEPFSERQRADRASPSSVQQISSTQAPHDRTSDGHEEHFVAVDQPVAASREEVHAEASPRTMPGGGNDMINLLVGSRTTSC
jgi:hypothetical protein